MKKIIFISCIFIIFVCSCNSNKTSSTPDKVAIEFTRDFFVGHIHAHKGSDDKYLAEALKPFEKGICAGSVYNDIREFYQQPLVPLLTYDEKFYANEEYKILGTFPEGTSSKFLIGLMKHSKEAYGGGLVAGLAVTVDSSGNKLHVSKFEFFPVIYKK